jgi:hypothetical protein
MKMKYKLFLALTIIVLTFNNCSNNIEEDSIKINGTTFIPDSITAFFEDSGFLIKLENENQAILIFTIGQKNLTYRFDENESINPAYIRYKINNIIYEGVSGQINIISHDQDLLSANFNAVLKSENGNIVKIENGTFNTVRIQTTTNPNQLTQTEMNEEDAPAFLNAVYKAFVQWTMKEKVIDFLYTNESQTTFYRPAQFYNHEVTAYHTRLEDFWTYYYRLNYRIIQTIKFAKEKIKTPGKLEPYLAQVYALRAYSNINMINWFGAIPYLTKIPTKEIDFQIPRTSTIQILDFALTDLEYANNYLPISLENSEGYIDKSFSQFLLMRIHWENKDFNKVLSFGKKLIDSKLFSLNNLEATDINDSEFIMALNLIDNFTDESYANREHDFYNNNKDFSSLLLYSEVLLYMAEASNKLGKNSEAIEYLNQLISRNNSNLIVSSNTEELNEKIFEQWITESKFNGNRFRILKHFEKAQDFLNIEKHELLLPIPIHEINNNKEITQNPGY